MRMAHFPLPQLPDARTLQGRYVRLERLSRHHGDDLGILLCRPSTLRLPLSRTVRTKREFDEWFVERLQRMDYHQYR